MPSSVQSSRRHHFLPLFYLRNWLDDLSFRVGKSPGVWVISRDGGNSRRLNPKNKIFWIEHANTLMSSDGDHTDRPERLLARVESVVASALRGPIAAHQPLDRDQVTAINMFFAAMLVRVPVARRNLQAGVDAQAQIERDAAAFEDRPVPDTSLYQRNAMGHTVSIALTAILPELDRMCHRILMAPPTAFFVTSDRPAIISAPVGFQGVANRFCEATIPLSPSRMLRLTWEPLDRSGYYPVSPDQVHTMNRRLVLGCSEWFVSREAVANPLWLRP